jgi:hypothetical protein
MSSPEVGRALSQLGIDPIAAYSPEARGRSERAFRTLQDRLPKELQLAGIGDGVAAANRFIAEVYLPARTARFAVAAAEAGSAFVPVAEAQWRDVLRPGGAHRRRRQHRRRERPPAADPAAPGPPSLRPGQGAGA